MYVMVVTELLEDWEDARSIGGYLGCHGQTQVDQQHIAVNDIVGNCLVLIQDTFKRMP